MRVLVSGGAGYIGSVLVEKTTSLGAERAAPPLKPAGVYHGSVPSSRAAYRSRQHSS